MPNKKENIENLQKKLGEVLGLERAAQKAVDELIKMKLCVIMLISRISEKLETVEYFTCTFYDIYSWKSAIIPPIQKDNIFQNDIYMKKGFLLLPKHWVVVLHALGFLAKKI